MLGFVKKLSVYIGICHFISFYSFFLLIKWYFITLPVQIKGKNVYSGKAETEEFKMKRNTRLFLIWSSCEFFPLSLILFWYCQTGSKNIDRLRRVCVWALFVPWNSIHAFWRWSVSAGFVGAWPLANTGMICSWVWNVWKDIQHVQVWDYGSRLENSRVLPLGWQKDAFRNADVQASEDVTYVTSIDHMMEWGKVSQWFHPKPLAVMTHAYFHALTHVMRYMINSQRNTFKGTTLTRVSILATLHFLVLELKKSLVWKPKHLQST